MLEQNYQARQARGVKAGCTKSCWTPSWELEVLRPKAKRKELSKLDIDRFACAIFKSIGVLTIIVGRDHNNWHIERTKLSNDYDPDKK